MKIIPSICFVFCLLQNSAFANTDHDYHSEYAGQESRDIKSLSPDDIDALRNGKGWGLAKAAELNGIPGPVHLLDMSNEIGLSRGQIDKVEALFKIMKQQAIPLGLQLINLEKELNKFFSNKSITKTILGEQLGKIAEVRKQLRYVHLATHLDTPNILSTEQINLYNQLRGYTSSDPCQNTPVGHDVAMWKKHNNCP